MRMSNIQRRNEIASVIKNNFPKVEAVTESMSSESENDYPTMMNLLFDLSHNLTDHHHHHHSILSAALTTKVFQSN